MSDEKQMSDAELLKDAFDKLDRGEYDPTAQEIVDLLNRLERANAALTELSKYQRCAMCESICEPAPLRNRIAALEAENAKLRRCLACDEESLQALRAQLASLSSPWIRCEEEFDGREQVWWWNRIAQRAQQVEKWTLNIGDLWQPCIPSPPEVENK